MAQLCLKKSFHLILAPVVINCHSTLTSAARGVNTDLVIDATGYGDLKKEGYQTIKKAGRSLSYLNGVRLNI